jgi:UDP-2,3-diacylglucosamine pyrophosphatase LpxH
MLVFISDLHFEDGTAGEHNLSDEAFTIFFKDLIWHAERRKAEDVTVVLLGDVFDLLRTTYWFGVPKEQRPWGLARLRKTELVPHAEEVLSRVVNKNGAALEAFREGVRSLRAKHIKTSVVYVPGNHDRLVNVLPTLRGKARHELDLGDTRDPFDEQFRCAEHAVLALHGHQFDTYNVEPITPENPDGVPIGDPLTTELITQLPELVVEALHKGDPSLTPTELDAIRCDFQELDNVRPMWAVVDWLRGHIRRHTDREAAVHQAVDTALDAFRGVAFVKDWFDLHDTWNPSDQADRLQWSLWLAGHMTLKSAHKVAPLLERFKEVVSGPDGYEQAARKLFQNESAGTRFVVMGHTHEVVQKAISTPMTGSGAKHPRVYLNTGTWRPRQHPCADASGFVPWKEMTYVMLFRESERPHVGMPSFETWTGNLESCGACAVPGGK